MRTSASVRRALVATALVLWLLGLTAPFIKGSIKLVVASVSRAYSVPSLVIEMFRSGRTATALILTIVLLAVPLGLFTWLANAQPPRSGVGRLRLAAAGWVALTSSALCLLAVRAAVDARGTPHLLVGFWLILSGLLLAAAVASDR